MNHSSHPVAHGPFVLTRSGIAGRSGLPVPEAQAALRRGNPENPCGLSGLERNSVQLPSIAGDCLITSAPKARIGDLQSRTGWRGCPLRSPRWLTPPRRNSL